MKLWKIVLCVSMGIILGGFFSVAQVLDAETVLVGKWWESKRLLCNGNVEFSEALIKEITFDGASYTVTWHPFETFVDYWGGYQVEAGTGNIQLDVDTVHSNNVPPEIDLEGHLTLINENTVRLDGIFLGTEDGSPVPVPVCGYELRRGYGPPVKVWEFFDVNNNREIEDAEIMEAIQFWISGDSLPVLNQPVDDAEILSLIQQWIGAN